MKSIITNTIGILVMITRTAFADTGAGATENGWLWMLFLGFGAVIVTFQFVPCLILFSTMLKAAFSSAEKANPSTTDAN